MAQSTNTRGIMESCYCCGKPVAVGEEKKRRRALNTTASKPFLDTLTFFITSRVKDAAIDLARLRTGHICRSCNDMIVNLHKKFDSKLAAAISILPKVTPGVSGSSGISSTASATQTVDASRVHQSVSSNSNTPPVTVSACNYA